MSAVARCGRETKKPCMIRNLFGGSRKHPGDRPFCGTKGNADLTIDSRIWKKKLRLRKKRGLASFQSI